MSADNSLDYDDGYMDSLIADLDRKAAGRPARPQAVAPVFPIMPRVDTQGRGDSWRPVDMAEVLSEGYEEPRPTIGRLAGVEHPLFYAGKLNTVFGESGAGKSWFLAFLIAQVIEDGRDAVVVDYEDSPGSWASRLMKVGVAKESIIRHLIYIAPAERWDGHAYISLAVALDDRDPALAVIDSAGEGMAADGTNPNADDEVARWFQGVVKTLANYGAAVVTIDHVGKSRENGFPRSPVGSFRKTAAIHASYALQAIVAPARDRDGLLKMTCMKDRHGYHKYPAVVAEVKMANGDDGSVVITTEAPASAGDGAWKPAVLMSRVCDALQEAGKPLSRTELKKLVSGKGIYVDEAVEHLVAGGNVSQEGGPRNAKMLTLVRHVDDDPAGDDAADEVPF